MASENPSRKKLVNPNSNDQHKDLALNQIEFTEEYKQKLEENWEMIKDDSDSEIAPW